MLERTPFGFDKEMTLALVDGAGRREHQFSAAVRGRRFV
jgi:hypothetical protein